MWVVCLPLILSRAEVLNFLSVLLKPHFKWFDLVLFNITVKSVLLRPLTFILILSFKLPDSGNVARLSLKLISEVFGKLILPILVSLCLLQFIVKRGDLLF